MRECLSSTLAALAEQAQVKPSTLEAQLQRARKRRETDCEGSSVDYSSVAGRKRSRATDEKVCCHEVTGDNTPWCTLEETVCACLLQVAPNGERPGPLAMQRALCVDYGVHTKKKAVELFLGKRFKVNCV